MKIKEQKQRLFLVLVLTLLCTPPALAKSERTGEEKRFGFGLSLGYGEGVSVRQVQKGTDVGDVEWMAIEPWIRMRLANLGDGQHWYDGSLSALLMGTVVRNFEPHSGDAGGAVAALRYTIRPGHALRPYFEAGVGVGRLDFKLQSQADGVCFFIHTTIGLRWALNDRFALMAGFNWQHISNAGINPPNAGLDTLGIRIGIEIQ
ncbi:MAG: acyloxyacyl hydrolase [Myxococcota bacterium]|nr:acyloxyacyl hydrolase [Myxococcota bacterium]